MEIDVKVQEQLIKAIESISSTSWHESPGFIAVVSGGLTLLGSYVTFCFNKKAEKQRIENEYNLKKVELENIRKEHIQNDQLAALKALSGLSHNLRPTIWGSPDYDSHEAYTDVVFRMGGFLSKLDSFLNDHRFSLPSNVIDKLDDVLFKCNSSHWGASMSDTPDYTPTSTELDNAKEVLELLSSVEKEFKQSLGIE
ncbi:hypothetical protein [Vibrio coralliilyticus]|uniref:hypothetical protein n=1 Tax=Vibrio coralliilyticus TaxID=190893 RepID=UPI001E4363FB|nr:hypothetical protein [Vibrio coralliilyticus]MCC2522195.1 hypothetical protein [Vibrio coralliilyticus]